ncbi:lysozyme inhibitor LprI family protein [Roseisalinus antarcticus]|uniref:Lysozyme inhibitor LprI-like N-terminal domain-containing protein n=1 Tax=Roseisalinus antarcticus TaxID=254357 RepID=A0A1Y5TX39_9RHOB|nr:lysozyme inhibitor LprI family protein [Roseisalinus antarcticus]SLN75861.1 hypothetical protein ROA7023_04039 [Roseisalinus antarcticus]
MTRTAHRLALLIAMAPLATLASPSDECSGSSQVEIANCVSDTLAAVDATVEMFLGFAHASATELDDVTGRAVSAAALDAGQAAWSAYRDAHCEFVGTTFGGGSGTGIAINDCRIELGRARAASLRMYVQ